MTEEAQIIRRMLKELISQAREEKKYLYCSYQGLWFSPDELEKANAEGRFLWGPVNWKLISPNERTKGLESEVERAKEALDRWKRKIGEAV